jgi:hypothetical protein
MDTVRVRSDHRIPDLGRMVCAHYRSHSMKIVAVLGAWFLTLYATALICDASALAAEKSVPLLLIATSMLVAAMALIGFATRRAPTAAGCQEKS